MRIMMLADTLGIGGVETHIEELVSGLERLGCETVVLSGGGRVARRLAERGLRHVSICALTRTHLLPLALLRILRIARDEAPDILHAHTRRSALLGSIVCRALHLPLVVSAHALFSMRAPRGALSVWGDATVAVSDDIAGLVSEHGARRVSVIKNGVDSGTVRGHDLSSHRIVFVSRLDSDCSLGARMLCDIAEALAERYGDLEILIVGGGGEWRAIEKRAEAICGALGRRVIETVGEVEDPRAYISRSALFLGVSRSAIEAMAEGVPVILIGNEGYMGLLDAENMDEALAANLSCRGSPAESTHESLFSEICRYFDMPEAEREALGALMMRVAREELGADEMARRTLALYEEVIAEHGRQK